MTPTFPSADFSWYTPSQMAQSQVTIPQTEPAEHAFYVDQLDPQTQAYLRTIGYTTSHLPILPNMPRLIEQAQPQLVDIPPGYFSATDFPYLPLTSHATTAQLSPLPIPPNMPRQIEQAQPQLVDIPPDYFSATDFPYLPLTSHATTTQLSPLPIPPNMPRQIEHAQPQLVDIPPDYFSATDFPYMPSLSTTSTVHVASQQPADTQDVFGFMARVIEHLMIGAKLTVDLSADGLQIDLDGETFANLQLVDRIKPYLDQDKSNNKRLIIPYFLVPVFCEQCLSFDRYAVLYSQIIQNYRVNNLLGNVVMPSLFKSPGEVSQGMMLHFLQSFQKQDLPTLSWYVINGYIKVDDIIQFGNAQALWYVIPNKSFGPLHASQKPIWSKIYNYQRSAKVIKELNELIQREAVATELFCQGGIVHYQQFFVAQDLDKILMPHRMHWIEHNQGGIAVEQSLATFFTQRFAALVSCSMESGKGARGELPIDGLVITCPASLHPFLYAQFEQAGLLSHFFADKIVIPTHQLAQFFQLTGFSHDRYDLTYELVRDARNLRIEEKRQLLMQMGYSMGNQELIELGYRQVTEPYLNILNAELQPNPEIKRYIETCFTLILGAPTTIGLIPEGLLVKIPAIECDVEKLSSKLGIRFTNCLESISSSSTEMVKSFVISLDQLPRLLTTEHAKNWFVKYLLGETLHRDSTFTRDQKEACLRQFGCHCLNNMLWVEP